MPKKLFLSQAAGKDEMTISDYSEKLETHNAAINTYSKEAVKADSKDRRVRKTRTALKHALTTLMLQKNINSISVKELTDLADINRGTFYLHYSDVSDLLSQSEDDLLDELKETLDRFSDSSFKNERTRLFTELYKLTAANADMVRILISENGDIKFLNKLKKLLRDKCLSDWKAALQEEFEHFDAYYAFIVGGCLSLIQYWFSNGMTETAAELAAITTAFLDHNVRPGTKFEKAY